MALNELADSIKEHGVLQPILVRPISGGGYRIVAGERRFRAAHLAGPPPIPAGARSLTARETAGLSTPAGFTLDAPGGATVTGVSLSPLGVVVEYTGDPESVPADAVAVALADGSAPAWETGRAACSGWNWGGKGYLVCRFAAPAEPVGAAVTLFGQPVPLS